MQGWALWRTASPIGLPQTSISPIWFKLRAVRMAVLQEWQILKGILHGFVWKSLQYKLGLE
ncbi:hypothetical protein [Paracidovorax avenae]|uniref:hypothetical protein n=1 Tax=Paracidovorax avenae TaxID=80867 RepID=UPI001CEF6306|nr:hypothetical protein [Paracidovorax avenae]